jgi:endoglucanase
MEKPAIVITAAILALVPCLAQAANGELPFLVDLTRAANRGLEDDGIAANGLGGWTDEGINDMYVYPKLIFGAHSWRGTPFSLIDPLTNDGRAVVMLRGSTPGADLPREVTASVPNVKGKYVFVMHTATARSTAPPEHLVATYVLEYADGARAELPIRHGAEIQHWYSGQWWDNRGATRYPVYMGRNSYSGRWRQWIGVWATRWENPEPDKPIASITFRSAEADVPVIFAATIGDADYSELRETPEYKIGRPPDVPEGFFDVKIDLERARIFELMKDEGLVEGLRRVEVIRPDLLAVTIDSALGAIGVGRGEAVAAAYQKPESFALACAEDPNYSASSHPVEVWRQTYKVDTRGIGPFLGNEIFWNTYYLRLAHPLSSGKTYALAVAGLDPRFAAGTRFTYDEALTQTPAIKVNQVAYAAAAKRRYAYLGWWAGDAGAIDFDDCEQFRVVHELTGRDALTGPITLRSQADEFSGERVYEMDLSGLSEQGRYHIVVPGLGRSYSFSLGSSGARALQYHTQRAFMHQRCGCDLTAAVTDFPREACHVQVYENGHLVGGKFGDPPDEPIRRFYGGYHDAADFDMFTRHLTATAQALAALELFPEALGDTGLDLPEGDDGAPDILPEAAWGLKFCADNQLPDGAILHGRCNDCDSARQVPREDQIPYGVFAAKNTACNDFAAVAAQYARLLRPFDPAKAGAMLERAEGAYAWARAHQPGEDAALERYWKLRWAWAAAELFETTGEAEYNDDFKMLHAAEAIRGDWKLGPRVVIHYWPYLMTKRAGADPDIQDALREDLLRIADDIVKQTDRPAYRMGRGLRGGGWGNAVGGGHYGDVCLRAYIVTGEQKYLDIASLNADYQLGANPLSMCFITGMGTRFPQTPNVSPFLKAGYGQTVKGISLYGPGGQNPAGHPAEIPEWRRFEDNPTTHINCEFTINECIGPAAFLYASFWGLQQDL